VTTSKSSYTGALIVLTSLFFLWGLITSLNDILVPHFKAIFTLTYVQAMLVQLCFFGAYFVASLPCGLLVERIGYRNGIVVGWWLRRWRAWLFIRQPPCARIRCS